MTYDDRNPGGSPGPVCTISAWTLAAAVAGVTGLSGCGGSASQQSTDGCATECDTNGTCSEEGCASGGECPESAGSCEPDPTAPCVDGPCGETDSGTPCADGVCSEHGVCDPGSQTCTCDPGWTGAACDQPPTDGPPAPTGLRVLGVSNNSVALDWADSPDPQVVSYTLYSSPDGVAFEPRTDDLVPSGHLDAGLTSATDYWYRVTATDAEGRESVSSDVVMATTSALVQPRPGSDPTFLEVSNDIVLNDWPAPSSSFWTGVVDINQDGCQDLVHGSHADYVSEESASRFAIHQTSAGVCQGVFRHEEVYAGPFGSNQPRATSRYHYLNTNQHPAGLWGYLGSDADGGHGALFEPGANASVGDLTPGLELIGPLTSGDAPVRLRFHPIDWDGDAEIELLAGVKSGYTSPGYNPNQRAIYGLDSHQQEAAFTDDEPYVPPGLKYDGSIDEAFPVGGMFAVTDIDGDSWPDVVSGAHEGYWLNQGGTDFGPLVTAFDRPAHAVIDDCRGIIGDAGDNHQVPLDYDGDGDMDLLFADTTYDDDHCAAGYVDAGRAYLSLYRNEGGGDFTDVTFESGLAGITFEQPSTGFFPTYQGSPAGDFNNDGCPDFVWSGENKATASQHDTTSIAINNCDGTFHLLDSSTLDFGPTGGLRPWIAVGDWDGDFDLDVIRNANTFEEGNVETLKLWENQDNGNNAMSARVRRSNNSDGMHTRIHMCVAGTGCTILASDTVITTRDISIPNMGQSNLVGHFGLGSNDAVDIRVTYPHGGPVHTYSNVPANQHLVFFEDGCLFEGWVPGEGWPMTSNEADCTAPDGR